MCNSFLTDGFSTGIPLALLGGWDRITSLKNSVSGIRCNSLFTFAFSRKRVYTCYLGNDVVSAICCNVSIFVDVETWLRSRCLAIDAELRLHYCCFQVSCRNNISVIYVCCEILRAIINKTANFLNVKLYNFCLLIMVLRISRKYLPGSFISQNTGLLMTNTSDEQ
jgi:hypothetical protein